MSARKTRRAAQPAIERQRHRQRDRRLEHKSGGDEAERMTERSDEIRTTRGAARSWRGRRSRRAPVIA